MRSGRTPSSSRISMTRIACWSLGSTWMPKGTPVCWWARATARRLFSSFALTVLVVPTSPMKPARTSVPSMPSVMSRTRTAASSSIARLREPGGVTGLDVVAGAGHDVDAGHLGHAPQADRVAPLAERRHLDEGAAAGVLEVRDLVGRVVHRLVPEVLLDDEGVALQDAAVVEPDGGVGQRPSLRRCRARSSRSGPSRRGCARG